MLGDRLVAPQLVAHVLEACSVQRNAGGRPGLSEAFLAIDSAAEVASAVAGLLGAERVGLVTGFVIKDAEGGPAAETDGPSGACALARTLALLGKRVQLFTEDLCGAVLRAVCETAWGASCGEQESAAGVACPPEVLTPSSGGFREALEATDCLVFVEKVGPGADGVPRSMRGIDISEYTSPVFAELCRRSVTESVSGGTPRASGSAAGDDPRIEPPGSDASRTTASPPRFIVAVGDGGNEIGCGRFYASFSHVTPLGIVCAVPAHALILCDVSNYGAHLLAALVARSSAGGPMARDGAELLARVVPDERALLQAAVAAGAVDGVRAKPCLSVDGLGLDEYLEVVRRIWEKAILCDPPAPARS